MDPNNPNQRQLMIPQFNLRTFVRFVTECAAVIQGLALVVATVTNWMQSQAGRPGQPGPLKQFWNMIKGFTLGGDALTAGGTAGLGGGDKNARLRAGVGSWAGEFAVRTKAAESSVGKISWKQSIL